MRVGWEGAILFLSERKRRRRRRNEGGKRRSCWRERRIESERLDC